jgi:DNA adenine methylase
MSSKSTLRTPVTYYGGKQKLLPAILKFIPKHVQYIEPFCGGAAVYFGKPPSEIEVLNDTNRELINFYQVCRNRFHELSSLIRTTLHSRSLHDDAWVIYNKPHLHCEVRRAWAVWVLSSQSFSAMLDGSWGYDKKDSKTTTTISNKREQFAEHLAIRLQNTQIECADALYIIKSRDTKESFFYIDPPYPGTDQGHYDGYSEQDFENLLNVLSSIKGKFLLSNYPSLLLQKYTKQRRWYMWSVEQGISVNARSGYLKRKTEVLIANFKIN